MSSTRSSLARMLMWVSLACAATALTVNRAQVVSKDPAGSRATVAVDLTESAADGQHHWSGAWYLVRGSSGWLLDQPSLQRN